MFCESVNYLIPKPVPPVARPPAAPVSEMIFMSVLDLSLVTFHLEPILLETDIPLLPAPAAPAPAAPAAPVAAPVPPPVEMTVCSKETNSGGSRGDVRLR